MGRCVCEQTIASSLVATVVARTKVVDEHMDYSRDCVSEFQMEVVSGERCAGSLMTVGPMHVEMKTVSTR